MNTYIISYSGEWREEDRCWAVVAKGYQHALEQLNAEVDWINLDFSSFTQDEYYPQVFGHRYSEFTSFFIEEIAPDEPRVYYLY